MLQSSKLVLEACKSFKQNDVGAGGAGGCKCKINDEIKYFFYFVYHTDLNYHHLLQRKHRGIQAYLLDCKYNFFGFNTISLFTLPHTRVKAIFKVVFKA